MAPVKPSTTLSPKPKRHSTMAEAARLLEQHLALTANLVARQMGSADLFP